MVNPVQFGRITFKIDRSSRGEIELTHTEPDEVFFINETIDKETSEQLVDPDMIQRAQSLAALIQTQSEMTENIEKIYAQLIAMVQSKAFKNSSAAPYGGRFENLFGRRRPGEVSRVVTDSGLKISEQK